jgi:hypothetical protein
MEITMAVTTTKTSCPVATWTKVADTVTAVILQATPRQNFLVAAGAAAPTDPADGIEPVNTGGTFNATFPAATKVWVMPLGAVPIDVVAIAG